jgi:hypothetical protein
MCFINLCPNSRAGMEGSDIDLEGGGRDEEIIFESTQCN